MVIIFLLSAQDAKESSQTSGFVVSILSLIFKNEIPHDLIRTLAHFSEYAVLAFFVSNALYAYKARRIPLFAPIISWGYAWTDEIHQIFVDGRAFQLFDLAVDLGGIILGTITFTLLIKVIKKLLKKQHNKKTI
jgi:VanZ family protein